MQQEYYTINEVISILRTINATISTTELINCAQEKIIRPIIYINSLGVFAGTFKEGKFLIHGHCLLTAYLDIGNDTISVFNNIIKSPIKIATTATDKRFFNIYKNQLLGKPKISSWEIDMNLFRAFARENIQLTTVINLSKLQAFMLHQNNFSINNIRISHCDVEKLKNLFFERLKKEKDRVPQKTSLHNKPKQKRSHALHELIRKIYKDIRDKSARAIWDKLLNQVDDKGILQSVDQWTGRGAKICWISYEGNEQSMIRKTFQTHISSLRRPENK